MRRVGLFALFSAALFPAVLYAQATSCTGMSLGQGASLNDFVPFPVGNAWNQDISPAPVDAKSNAIINFIGANAPLHPDFGAGRQFDDRHSVHRGQRLPFCEHQLHSSRG